MAVTMKFLVSVLFVFLYIDSCKSTNLTIGTNINAKLEFAENVKLPAIPFISRTKNCFYNANTTIKGIYAIDMDKTKSVAKVTSGGVGFTFTNVKLKSERGNRLNYHIQIFV